MISETDAVVNVMGVTKIFRDFWHREKVAAVNDLSFEVHQDEIFGLLGPNGSGKSTTVKMILGLLYPTRGQIRVLGQHPTHVATKSRLGFLPEESYLYPFLSAYETLDFYGRLFRQSRPLRRKRVEMLLDMVGLAKVAFRRVGEYSKGMQRRIGLAQALINDPDLLILDEPTSGLDPLGTRQFKDLILELSRRGKTVILCSHLLSDVEDVCDRVSILYGGRMRAEGGVADLLRQQDLTEIVADRLSDDTIDAVRKVIAQREGKAVVDVTHPKDKLENLFLRIVAEAQTARLDTGGAVATGEVAAFLRADQPSGEAVLADLVTEPVAATDQTTAEEAPPAPVEPDRNVLGDLAAASEPRHEPEDDEATVEPAPPPADRGVIDSLLDDDSATQDDSHA
ncbi:MAG: ATP-binding cassette domain-containing protein [Planctomycetota bacterium]